MGARLWRRGRPCLRGQTTEEGSGWASGCGTKTSFRAHSGHAVGASGLGENAKFPRSAVTSGASVGVRVGVGIGQLSAFYRLAHL